MSKVRALLIEDEEDQQILVKYLMDFIGVELRTLPNDIGLLETLLEFEPNIIIIDIALPGIDGFTLISGIHRTLPKAKIMAYSAKTTSTTFDRFRDNAIALGATEFLEKPYDINRFTDIIEGMMQ